MAERKPIVLLSDNNLAELPVGDSLAWSLLSGVPVYATRWPAWEEVSGKPTTFTPAEHTHTIANVSGLQSALDGKAAASHTHTITDVTGLQAALDGKAAASHTHDLSALTQSGATTGQVPQWNGTAWVPSTVAGGGGGGLTWQTVAVNTTMASGNGYNANGALSMSLPLTISTGDRFAVHALGSTVTVLRNGNTITYKGTDVADDVTIAPGETIYLVATAADVLEIV